MGADAVAACWEGNAEAWTRLVRAGYGRYRDRLNTPAFLAMLAPIAGVAGLDTATRRSSCTFGAGRRGEGGRSGSGAGLVDARGVFDLSIDHLRRHAQLVGHGEPVVAVGFH